MEASIALGATSTIFRRIIPILILWELWKARNGARYDGIPMLVNKCFLRIKWWINLILEGDPVLLQMIPRLILRRQPPLCREFLSSIVKWTKPARGWVKPNMDGSSRGNPGLVGRGGIYRRDDGSFAFTFSRGYGVTTNNRAELRVFYDGLV
ncbi:uncharacterized protein LOC131254329 [Magnolia sinica]|uniref:uncharacterized protein LOC131254329 n=1 Tax=Magnolia sinica TaxID=86752 RepID=UPI00265ACD36|nr:uncharacterized protein LOC131254329 [Magnolia sinica]